jgi:SpoIID/LytB domain protein
LRYRGSLARIVLVLVAAAGGHHAPVAVVAAQADGGRQPGRSDAIRIGVLHNGRYDVTTLPIETYVARVLTGEAAPDSAPAALEALAIAIRTYTVTNRGRHGADGFDLCDQTHCQVMRASSPVTERAALATAQQILLSDGAPATVYYSASCGGRSEKPSNVWPGAPDPSYLSIHDDDGCGGFPQWTAQLAASDLQRALAAGGYRGTLRNVRIAARNDSGRVARLLLDGMTPGEISGQDLRMVVGRTLGFQHLQSTAFELRRTGSAFRFTGKGAGHGVGLCVIGSMKLAASGQAASAILARYFPGAAIGSSAARMTAAPPRQPAPPSPAASDILVEPRDMDAADRALLTATIDRERQQLARALGVAPPRVSVRVHSNTDAFERTTGQPWFTLGAVAQGEMHLPPLRLLIDRGMVAGSVRHQLVHVMADGELPERPAWIREGAAVYFSMPDAAGSRPPCPQDVELQRPISIGALADAYARARTCFERQVSGGRDWRRVR